MNNNQASKYLRITPLRYFLILIFAAAIAFQSCKKDDSNTPVEHIYLISYDKINDYSPTFIRILLSAMDSVYPGINALTDKVNYGIDLYTITYKTHFKGNEVTASGLVCIPMSTGTFPFLSFQNGTNTSKLNAPSVNYAFPLYTLIEMMASHGYIVVIPDYLGFGASSSMLHPYYDKESTAQAVTDMILAAHELLAESSIEAKGNGKHFLMGYSQGGWATLSELKKIEAGYSSEIPVSAVSCGAGAYDLNTMSEYVLSQTVYPGPLYLPYFIYSKITAGDLSQPLSVFFKPPYDASIPETFNGNYDNGAVDARLTDTIANLVTDDLRLNLASGANFASLRNLMQQNSISAWNTPAPLRFYHGTNDLNVPPFQSETIYNQFRNLGLPASQVSLIPIEGATHDTGLIPWGVSTIQWFDSLNK